MAHANLAARPPERSRIATHLSAPDGDAAGSYEEGEDSLTPLLRLAAIEPCQMMVEVAMRVQTSLADDRTRVFLEVDHDTPALFADRRRLELALEELVVNALEAMPQGGYLHLEASGTPSEEKPRRVVLRVSDTGPGIPSDLRTRVLEPGFSTREGRHGLGLARVRDTVYAHGGVLLVGADPTGGAEIRLVLPAA